MTGQVCGQCGWLGRCGESVCDWAGVGKCGWLGRCGGGESVCDWASVGDWAGVGLVWVTEEWPSRSRSRQCALVLVCRHNSSWNTSLRCIELIELSISKVSLLRIEIFHEKLASVLLRSHFFWFPYVLFHKFKMRLFSGSRTTIVYIGSITFIICALNNIENAKLNAV